ncbi:protein unc-13 homolog [Diospyros lotus]|uniref:protein unc-13 homolog n=1 Tax=Diospyros lotus TaxID=55363 RepID=UPI00224CE42E|nr:protein unc-13 homolog [Diospyros lotus]
MGHQTHPESMAAETSQHHVVDPSDGAAATSVATADLPWPFAKLDGIDLDDLRDTAYEIFFTACRSAPGFGGRHALSYYPSEGGGGEGGGSPKKGAGVAPSRIKRALGLKILRRSQSRRTSSMGSSPFSPPAHHSHHHHTASSPGLAFSTVPQYRSRRPMTSAEIMRQQMNVTEQSDHRLRKTLMRTLVGQLGRRPETIILPLELLRHLKPSEFNDTNEYHLWQMRQLKILEAGLVLFPSIHLDKSNQFAMRLKEIVRSSEIKPIDTGKNSEIMKTLYNCVVSLAWRTPDGFPTNTCRWADGFPVNVNIYTVLLRAIFDLKDETMVLDEVDELLDLMKKTWSMLGINKGIHNLCFTWVLFHQYVVTGQVEADLLSASLAMLNEVAADAKRGDYGEPLYVKMLSSVLNSMKKWSEKRLLNYHGTFYRGTVGLMENLLPLVFSVTNILEEDVENKGAVDGAKDSPAASSRVDHYIRSSLQFAFTRLLENGNVNGTTFEVQEVTEALLQIAKETEELALKEKIIFSPVLKKWHPVAAGVAAVTLHNCYGTLLKQYLGGVSVLTNETVMVLQRAGKLEKSMVQMVVEDSVDCEDGGKSVVREMVPYEVDTFIVNLLKQWIQERLNIGKQRLQTAKETETWNPKSKTEPYAQSSVELMKHAKETVDAFLEIPLGISEELVHDLADGLENLFRDYTTFVASCGCKQSYMPTLPPLTRCNRDSTFLKLWKRASPCAVTVDDTTLSGLNEGNHPRPSTSRGTQRLYIRLNTLHYLLSQIHSLDKVLSTSPRIIPLSHSRFNKPGHIGSSSYFEMARSGIQEATQHVSEVAAYRLIFLDSNSVFYDTLYVADVKNARIKPALRILKQNLTLLGAMVTDRAQPLAIKEVMKASFEAFLMVLLAGGTSRTFSVMDHEMIADDFDNLKRVFCTCGEGLISEDTVDREAEMVEGVVALMGQSTGQLVEDFSIVACEASGIGIVGAGQKLPMPPTTGRWNRLDPNTLLRVLCHRNDRSANEFLKRTFQLAKRR